MTKSKKHSRPTLQDTLDQPWCYYCEKTCSDVGALLSHQKDKHFQCLCRRRLNTAGGLKVHMAQVHKEELKEVPNALPHRKDPSVEVFTMYGIPEDVLNQHRQEVETEFYRQEYEHRVRTGNPAPGTAQPGAIKKPKIESAESLKARVALRRAENAARKAAEAAGNPVQFSNPVPQVNSPNAAEASFPFSFSMPPPGINAFSTPPGMPQYPVTAPPMPFQQMAGSPVHSQPFAPIPSSSPASMGLGQFAPPGQQDTQPKAAPPTNTQANGGSKKETTNGGGINKSLQSVSLPTLYKYGLAIIKAMTSSSKAGNPDFKPADIFVAICERIYNPKAPNANLIEKAENVLRGLLNIGVESSLSAGFSKLDIIPKLKASTVPVTNSASAEQDGQSKSKKKNVEILKLSTAKSLGWEEEYSQSHGGKGKPHGVNGGNGGEVGQG